MCVSVASVLCVHHALYNLATLGNLQEDYHSISFVPVCEPSKPVFTEVFSDFTFPFPAAVAGTGQVSLPGADVFRQVTACHWPNMWQI